MLHDVIPILYPEYCGPDMTRQHRRALETVIRRAAAMIATSETSAAEIHDMLKERGRSDMPIKVTRLPVDDSFLVERGTEPHRSADPYFVVVGAIDQRKNHRMLLNVWREIAREGARKAPKLLVIGARSLRSEGIVDFMSRCPALVDTVIETNGLSTPAMREFIRDARALLMPSFTEGFGLPIIEALALGTPVIASDIEAHREVGGAFAHYIDPLDGAAWQDEICARASESDAQLQERRNRLSHFAPQTWTSYFEDVMPFIYSL
jgi:glycosyltransferase involved in cell wall biosynthesis